MNVTEEQLSRVERVDSTPERAPKFGLDRPYDGDFIFNGTKVRFMATTPGGIEELRLVYQEYKIFSKSETMHLQVSDKNCQLKFLLVLQKFKDFQKIIKIILI